MEGLFAMIHDLGSGSSMAYVQKKCGRCRASIAEGSRACVRCGSREFAYVARYRAPDHSERSRAFGRRIDAERFAADQENRKAAGTWIDPRRGRETLGAFYDRWRAGAEERGTLAPSTIAKYQGIWDLYVAPSLGWHGVAKITRKDVRDLVDMAAKRSPWQAHEALKLVRMLLNRALDDELIGRNPAMGIPAPSTDRSRVRVLKPWELEAIVANLPERWRAFALLGAYASLRWSELVAVKRDDIDIEERMLRIDEKVVEVRGRFEWGEPKTRDSARTVHLPEVAVKPLAAHVLRFPPVRACGDPQWEGLVFYGNRRGPVRRHVFRPIWDRACRAVGLESIRPEWLRHTGASLAYAASRDMKAVASRLGHTSTRMMDTVYVDVYSDVSRQVADAIDVLVQESSNRT
jgi:integrase